MSELTDEERARALVELLASNLSRQERDDLALHIAAALRAVREPLVAALEEDARHNKKLEAEVARLERENKLLRAAQEAEAATTWARVDRFMLQEQLTAEQATTARLTATRPVCGICAGSTLLLDGETHCICGDGTMAGECEGLRREAQRVGDELARLTEERDEARDWVRKMVHETQELRCAFCGLTYPPGTPGANDEALSAHIRVCEEHPMREVEAQLATAQAERDEARKVQACGHPQAWHDRSVESDYEFCRFCECQSMLRDALHMEHLHRDERDEARRCVVGLRDEVDARLTDAGRHIEASVYERDDVQGFLNYVRQALTSSTACAEAHDREVARPLEAEIARLTAQVAAFRGMYKRASEAESGAWDQAVRDLQRLADESKPIAEEHDAAVRQAAREEMREEAAKVAENGRFLHDDAPDARFGRSCATAIRRLP